MSERGTSPKTPVQYDPEKVGAALLYEIAERHPERLTFDGLVQSIVADPHDRREVETAGKAIRKLWTADLVRWREDGKVVEPTQAALYAHALLTGTC